MDVEDDALPLLVCQFAVCVLRLVRGARSLGFPVREAPRRNDPCTLFCSIEITRAVLSRAVDVLLMPRATPGAGGQFRMSGIGVQDETPVGSPRSSSVWCEPSAWCR